MILLTIVVFIIILGLLIFVHELGHFIMARRAGMVVEEFGFGFPPRLAGFKRGETVYSLNLIPLGGFVKILGEDNEASDNPRSFALQSFGKRFSVLVAGVTMNAVLAWLLISIGLGLGLPTIIAEDQSLPKNASIKDQQVGVLEVALHSPATEAGFKVGDAVIAVNDERVSSVEHLQNLTKQNVGKPTKYTIKRGQTEIQNELIPRTDPPPGQGPLGISLATIGRVSYPWYEVLPRGLVATFNMLIATISILATVIGRLFSGLPLGVDVTGPVGIATLTRDVTQLGFIYVLQFTALLSINLAVINTVPFPALDGGRLLFLLLEKIRGRKLGKKVEQLANTVGFMLLILLMILVTIKDISRFTK